MTMSGLFLILEQNWSQKNKKQGILYTLHPNVRPARRPWLRYCF